MTMTTSQNSLFDDEPADNSPEDIGYGSYKEPVISCLPVQDARRFLDWLDQQDVKRAEGIGLITCMEALSGCTQGDLRWLCAAIHQAGIAPAPGTMKKAVLARDVAVLRGV